MLNFQFFKSKNFILHCKEVMLKALFHTLNDSNNVDLRFERSHFQFYKAFIGKGNNAALVVQLFKNNRWWWNVHQALPIGIYGDVMLPNNGKENLYKEDFKEHNFIWTQWKKYRHFHYLKPINQ